MMVIYWIIGIALVVWIVRKFTTKQKTTKTEAEHSTDAHHKKDDTCCHT